MTHILRAAAEQSAALSRRIYVMRVPGCCGWVIAPELTRPCCLLAMVAGREVTRWFHPYLREKPWPSGRGGIADCPKGSGGLKHIERFPYKKP